MANYSHRQCIALLPDKRRCNVHVSGDFCYECHDRLIVLRDNYRSIESEVIEILARHRIPCVKSMIPILSKLITVRKEFMSNMAESPTIEDNRFSHTRLLTGMYLHHVQFRTLKDNNSANIMATYTSRLAHDPFQRLTLLKMKCIIEAWLYENELFSVDYSISINSLSNDNIIRLWSNLSSHIWFDSQSALAITFHTDASSLCAWKNRTKSFKRSKITVAVRNYLLLPVLRETSFLSYNMYDLGNSLINSISSHKKLLIIDKLEGLTNIDKILDKTTSTFVVVFSNTTIPTKDLEHLYGSLVVINSFGVSDSILYCHMIYIIMHYIIDLNLGTDVSVFGSLDCLHYIYSCLGSTDSCSYHTYESRPDDYLGTQNDNTLDDQDINKYLA